MQRDEDIPMQQAADGTIVRRSAPAITFAQVESGMAGLVVVAGLVIGSFLIPMGVDDVASSDHVGEQVVALVATEPDRIRIGYLLCVIALLCVGPATSYLRRLAPERGRWLTDVGLRLIRIGSLFGAVGNAFAPLILPSTVGLDRLTMGAFVHQHESSATSYAILVVYGLLPVGGVLLAAGLSRADVISRWLAIPLGLSIGAMMPLRFGWQLCTLGVLLAVTLFLAWRASFKSVTPSS